jgi:methionine biosynthesis protein MetW
MMDLRTDLALISEWIAEGSHVLDLGCGDGTLLAHLRDTRSVTGYGLEIDDENIALCLQARVNVIHTDLNQGLSDFADDSFDYVVMTQAIQTIHQPDKLLIEMLRVGRQGIVTFPNVGSGIFKRRVGFIQDKFGGLIRILQDVKAAISIFLDRSLMINAGCLNKIVNILRFNLDMDKGNVH